MSAALRLGLVGAGRWGRNYLRTVARRDDAFVAAVASRNPDTARLIDARCRAYTDWQALLEEKLDGVIIATTPATHLAIARRFGERGVAVLVEKPLCLDLGEAMAFRKAAEQYRAPVLVDHLHLFSPAYRLLKQLSRLLGENKELRQRIDELEIAQERNAAECQAKISKLEQRAHESDEARDAMATTQRMNIQSLADLRGKYQALLQEHQVVLAEQREWKAGIDMLTKQMEKAGLTPAWTRGKTKPLGDASG